MLCKDHLCYVIFLHDVLCIADWLSHMFKLIMEDEHAEIIALYWAFWEVRNNLVWNQKKSTVNNVVSLTKQYPAEWNSAQLNATKALHLFVEHGD